METVLVSNKLPERVAWPLKVNELSATASTLSWSSFIIIFKLYRRYVVAENAFNFAFWGGASAVRSHRPPYTFFRQGHEKLHEIVVVTSWHDWNRLPAPSFVFPLYALSYQKRIERLSTIALPRNPFIISCNRLTWRQLLHTPCLLRVVIYQGKLKKVT
jgi:hypothetical protein